METGSYNEAVEQAVEEINGQHAENGESQGDGLPVEGQQENQEGQSQTQGQQQGTQQTGGQPAWNPQEWALKYRDKVVIPRDRQHLVDLAQQGFSYSSRMQELKEFEKQLNSQKGKYSQYQKLEEAFEKNPAFRKRLLDWYNESMNGGGQQHAAGTQSGQNSAVPPEIMETIADLRERVSKYDEERQLHEEERKLHEQERADNELKGEIDELKKKYARQDWDTLSTSGKTLIQEICEYAYQNGGIKLETAYRDLMWDSHSKNSEANGRKAAADAAAAAKKAGVVSGGKSKGAAAPQEANTKEMSYDEIAKHVQKEYNLTS